MGNEMNRTMELERRWDEREEKNMKRRDKHRVYAIENSGNYVIFSPEFSNGQSSRTKFLNAPRIKSRILDVLKTSDTINRIVHKENQEKINYSSLRNLNNLPVENISTLFCFLNDSSDHNPQLREIDSAKYCISLSCGEISLASPANLLKSSNGIGSTCSFIFSNTSDKSLGDNLLLLTISPKFLPISVKRYSGEINSIFFNDLFNRKTSKTVPLDSNAENNLLASTTISIVNYSSIDCKNLFDNSLSTLSDNSLTSSSDNCDLKTIERSLALSCNSLFNKNLITNERFPDSSISCFQSSGIITLISVMQLINNESYKKLSAVEETGRIKMGNEMNRTMELERRWNEEMNEREEKKERLIRDQKEGIILEHEIYTISNVSNLSSYKIISLPSKFSSFISLSNLEKAIISDFGLFCGILNQTIENNFSLGNFEESVKCLSFDISILFSDFENSANLPLESPFGLNIASKPFCFRKSNNSLFMFSSNKNFILCRDQFEFSFSKLSSKLQGCFYMLFFKGNKEIIQDFFNGNACFKQFQNLPDHNSSSFESRSASANLTVCNNIFINFDSHKEISYKGIFKSFDKMKSYLAFNMSNNSLGENTSTFNTILDMNIRKESLYKKLSIEMRKEKMKKEPGKKEDTEWN